MRRPSADARPARPSDADAIARIERSWPSAAGWTREQLAAEAERPEAVFGVREADGAVAAYVVARVEAGELRVYAVGVAPELARQGHAKRALAWALDEGRKAGCAKAFLEVAAANEAALALYRGAGFKIVGRRTKFYNDGSDALLLDLPL